MEFRLTFPVGPFNQTISYRNHIFLVGSCFAQNMGELLAQYKFNSFTNPNGIVYNPISIAKQLQRLLKNESYTENDLFNHNELWSSWEHHGQFSRTSKKDALEGINKSFNAARESLKQAKTLIITFGSAYVYELNEGNKLIANCHKYPNNKFTKKLLSVTEIIAAFSEFIALLKQENTHIQLLFSVSPVRYKRDGLVNSNLSKAILLQATHELCNSFENAEYFPAYELVMDDLRDYRFFTEDLVHPNNQAVQYVWEQFNKTMFDDETQTIYQTVKEINQAAAHKPFNTDTEAHKAFKRNYLVKTQQLEREFPFLNLSELQKAFDS